MAIQSARPCPSCGVPLPPINQRFCPNCGAMVDGEGNKQTELTPNSGAGSFPTYSPPPPPVEPGSYAPTYQSYQAPPPSVAPQNYQQPQPSVAPQSYQQPPVYAKPQKDATGSVLGQIGCGMLTVILVVLALCGGAGWFAWHYITASTTNSNITYNTNNNGGSGTKVVQTISKTVQLNEVVTYSGVTFTFKNAQQANFFSDDSSSSYQSKGVLRLNYHEDNPGSRAASYYYGDSFRLQLPDQTSAAPLNLLNSSPPSSAISRDNWLDFKVSQDVDIKHVVLSLGKEDEAQMEVPLVAGADLSKYQDKTVQPNKQAQYSNTTWTITKAKTAWSYENKQADKGMIFVIVDVRIDNSSSTDFRGYYGDYIRLKAGDTTSTLTGDTTVPLAVPAGSSNQMGEAAFLVPQGASSYTFVLLGDSNGAGVKQATITFQI